MILTFKKILVGIDFSSISPVLIAQAEILRDKNDGDITLLNVSNHSLLHSLKEGTINPKKNVRKFNSLINKIKKPQMQVFEIQGEIAESILDFAENHKIELIFLGHSQTGVISSILGSVARKVSSISLIPVLIIQTPALSNLACLITGQEPLDRIIAQCFDFFRASGAKKITFISLPESIELQDQITDEINHFTHQNESSKIEIFSHQHLINESFFNLLEQQKIDLLITTKFKATSHFWSSDRVLFILENFKGNTLILPLT